MIKLSVNGSKVEVDVPQETPLLWALREELQLTGTKFGCGKGLCGACTVHLDGTPVRSCLLSVGALEGRHIRTIESLGGDHTIQKAWIAEGAPQCGYCQPGQIMQALPLVESKASLPSDEDIAKHMSGNLCRCGSYPRILAAIRTAKKELNHD